MRAIFVLITGFLLLCFFSARWYICGILDLCSLPGDQAVGEKTVAILQILLVILIAFLTGFGVSWLLRDRTFKSARQQFAWLLNERNSAVDQLKVLEKENLTTRKRLIESQMEATQLVHRTQSAEVDLQHEKGQVQLWQQETKSMQERFAKHQAESESLQERVSQLENEIKQKPQPVVEEKKPQAIVSSAPIETRWKGSRFTPATWQTGDDLTLISGIGHGIQRKLNDLGVYSFQQVSELTPDEIYRINAAIKFFPGRIGRDNWIGQAAAFRRK